MPKTSNLARLLASQFIHQRILANQYPNASTLAASLELSLRTVQQYIRELPELYGATPRYDRTRHGFYYDKKPSLDPAARLSDKELVAYFLLDEFARSLSGSPVKDYLDTILAKFSTLLPVGPGLSIEQFSSAMSFRLERAPAKLPQPALLADLFQCIYTKKRARIVYESRERKELTHRTIDPLHLTRIDGQWFLIAWCHLRSAIRTFVPFRIQSLFISTDRFKPPADFDPGTHLRSAFGIVSGKDVADVSLLFHPSVADLIAERNWHVTQTIERLSGGAVRLRMKCFAGRELLAWLSSWGADVKIETPWQLKQDLRNLHVRAIKESGWTPEVEI